MLTVTTTTPTAIVIDDDPAIREALGSLIRSRRRSIDGGRQRDGGVPEMSASSRFSDNG